MEINKAFKFRFYPDRQQEEILAKTFGCVRYTYNHMLRVRTDAWYQHKKRIGYHETSAMLTELKRQENVSWLSDVSSVPLQQSLRNLQSAFSNFFSKRSKYPAFKSKHDKQTATYAKTAFKWDGENLSVAKMDKPLSIRWSRTLPKSAIPLTVTLSKDAAGRYFVSISCTDIASAKKISDKKIGIDLGIASFVTTSDGSKYNSPRSLKNNISKLAKLQRRMSKKVIGSNNQNKARLKVAKLHAKIADTRKDFLHKLSTKIVNENQVIAIESLAVSNMMKNRKLSCAIADASWYEFVRQLEYKSNWYGRTLISIDKWYPSSKRCNCCGFISEKMPLDIRSWICYECNTIHDRDINAAKNILTAGLAGIACGDSASPICI